MRIETPTTIEHVAWEGNLVSLGQTFAGADTLASVALGEPVWWPAEQAMENETGKKWTPPADARQYTVIRLVCTLYPPKDTRAHFTEATLTLYLRPRQGNGKVFAHALFPERLAVEQTGKFTGRLGPELKFGGALDAKVGELGADIDYQKAFPVIQAFGLGEAKAFWQFTQHAAHPLLGCQSVYAVAAAPNEAQGIRLSIELVATVETRFGLIRYRLPETAQANVSRLIATPNEGASHD